MRNLSLLLGLLGALAVPSRPIAAGQTDAQATNGTGATLAPAPAVPAESSVEIDKQFKKLMSDDDDAQAEVDRWIRENLQFQAKGGGVPREELNRHIRERFEPVRQGYDAFLKAHPGHAKARVAYGSFLNDMGDEAAARDQFERALTLDPKDPAIYNNLANIYGSEGPVKKAFECYGKAIELNPRESTYYQNLATAVYVFRKDAMEFYNLTELQVLDKSLELYQSALKFDPDNFPLASDLAQTYYAIRPLRTDAALNAWTNTLHLAHDELEREGVYIHLARFKCLAGRFAEAQAHLDAVTNSMYLALKKNLTRLLAERQQKAKETNAPPAAAAPASPPQATNAAPRAVQSKSTGKSGL